MFLYLRFGLFVLTIKLVYCVNLLVIKWEGEVRRNRQDICRIIL